MYLDITEAELQEITEEIGTFLGAYSIEVDLTKKEVLITLRRALQEFEKETSIWQINNQFGNVYGLPKGLLLSNQIATMNFTLVNQITDWFASMSRTGGKIPWHKDYILLESNRQIYNLALESSKPYPPGTRRINRVLWAMKPETTVIQKFGPNNVNGDDVLYSGNWNFTNDGLNYGSNRLGFVGYTFDTVMMMQAAENRNKIMFSEYFHSISGDILEITPMPGRGIDASMHGTKLFYYYFEESEVALNAKNIQVGLNEEANSEIIIDPIPGIPSSESDLIANPLDFKIELVPWSKLSAWARAFIFDYALARCKYIQGSKWRKIQKTMAGGDMSYEIQFDYQSLLNESQNEVNNLTNRLREDLRELSITKILNDKRDQVDAAVKINNRTPKLWSIM